MSNRTNDDQPPSLQPLSSVTRRRFSQLAGLSVLGGVAGQSIGDEGGSGDGPITPKPPKTYTYKGEAGITYKPDSGYVKGSLYGTYTPPKKPNYTYYAKGWYDSNDNYGGMIGIQKKW